jgi:hypothetical protein
MKKSKRVKYQRCDKTLVCMDNADYPDLFLTPMRHNDQRDSEPNFHLMYEDDEGERKRVSGAFKKGDAAYKIGTKKDQPQEIKDLFGKYSYLHFASDFSVVDIIVTKEWGDKVLS